MLMDLKANQRRGCSGDNEVLIPGCFLYELWWDGHYFNSALASFTPLSVHCYFFYQLFGQLAKRKLTRKLTKLAPKLINGLWLLWRNKKPENKKKNLYHAFCVFLGCPAKPRWKFLKDAADSNFFFWHKQSRNKSHLKLSWPLPRTICLTCKEQNASVSVHTFTEAT